MQESERITRIKENMQQFPEEYNKLDQKFAERIYALLDDPKIDEYCMVDAYYYDFCEIPVEIQKELNLWRDAYLIFGINTDGEIISKWVDRWDLDSSDPILYGKVVRKKTEFYQNISAPDIPQNFNRNLLSTPTFSIKGIS